jgi:hypothetical protein
VHHVGAKQLQRAAQDDRGRDAIDVIVAVDGDPIVRRNRTKNPVDRDGHAGQAKRVIQVVDSRRQESSRVIGGPKAANAKQPRGHGDTPSSLDSTIAGASSHAIVSQMRSGLH